MGPCKRSKRGRLMIKGAKLLGLAAAVGAIMAGGTAQAETDVTFNVGVATDYIFRGTIGNFV